jgi:hypothetical protein
VPSRERLFGMAHQTLIMLIMLFDPSRFV